MLLHVKQVLDRYVLQPQNVVTLEGHRAPVNCLAFTREGSVLASGGDDQKVVLWDVETFKVSQTLTDQNERWGQITYLQFIEGPAGELLCFGTGRGSILIFKRNKRSGDFAELSHARVFPFSDSVECFDYCKVNQKFVATSHFGLVKMFRFDGVDLKDLWLVEMPAAIPRSVYFIDKGEHLLIYGMEIGAISARDSETAAEKYTKVLQSAIGNVSMSPSGRSILVDNMTTGFDLYGVNRTVPKQSFLVQNSRRFIKNGIFIENGNAVVCGSDHGRAYIFNVNGRGDRASQVLEHRSSTALIQAIGTTTQKDFHYVATGAAENGNEIHLWSKPVSGTSRGNSNAMLQFLKYIIFVLIAIFLAVLLSQTWVLRGLKNSIHTNIGHHLHWQAGLNKPHTIEALYRLNEVELLALLELKKQEARIVAENTEVKETWTTKQEEVALLKEIAISKEGVDSKEIAMSKEDATLEEDAIPKENTNTEETPRVKLNLRKISDLIERV